MLGIRYAVSLSERSVSATVTGTHPHSSHHHSSTRSRTNTNNTNVSAVSAVSAANSALQHHQPSSAPSSNGLSGLHLSSYEKTSTASRTARSSAVSVSSMTHNQQSAVSSTFSHYPSSSDDSDSELDDAELEEEFLETKKYKFPSEGSELTPAHQMSDFKFKDYCPQIFRQLREWFRISTQEYLVTICGDFKLLEFISNSKSGQFFFFSHNSQFSLFGISTMNLHCDFIN